VRHVARKGDNRRAYRVSVKRELWERDRPLGKSFCEERTVGKIPTAWKEFL
jgi:hypothetical protein